MAAETTNKQQSPIAWVRLCATCAGYLPLTNPDYVGALSGGCQGCGTYVRELHRFATSIDSASGCNCLMDHRQVVGNLANKEEGLLAEVERLRTALRDVHCELYEGTQKGAVRVIDKALGVTRESIGGPQPIKDEFGPWLDERMKDPEFRAAFNAADEGDDDGR